MKKILKMCVMSTRTALFPALYLKALTLSILENCLTLKLSQLDTQLNGLNCISIYVGPQSVLIQPIPDTDTISRISQIIYLVY